MSVKSKPTYPTSQFCTMLWNSLSARTCGLLSLLTAFVKEEVPRKEAKIPGNTLV